MNRPLKTLMLAALVAVIALPAAPSMSASPAEIIKERRAMMKQNGGHMKAIGAYLKEGKGSAADVRARAEKLGASAARMAALFPRGTGLNDNVGETGAKPEIWQDWAAFKAGADKMGRMAASLAAAAATGQKGKIAGAMRNFGKQACGSCHRGFRKKLN